MVLDSINSKNYNTNPFNKHKQYSCNLEIALILYTDRLLLSSYLNLLPVPLQFIVFQFKFCDLTRLHVKVIYN